MPFGCYGGGGDIRGFIASIFYNILRVAECIVLIAVLLAMFLALLVATAVGIGLGYHYHSLGMNINTTSTTRGPTTRTTTTTTTTPAPGWWSWIMGRKRRVAEEGGEDIPEGLYMPPINYEDYFIGNDEINTDFKSERDNQTRSQIYNKTKLREYFEKKIQSRTRMNMNNINIPRNTQNSDTDNTGKIYKKLPKHDRVVKNTGNAESNKGINKGDELENYLKLLHASKYRMDPVK